MGGKVILNIVILNSKVLPTLNLLFSERDHSQDMHAWIAQQFE